ncbi:ABC transporter permease [Marichromatium bheemlicum]|uniref:ABC transporter permease n=1 Tax=Marichromatium bheemlicum TaxID=365339 RepID=A0ABX1I715_9GAMM|nr:ABC transporter permease [Marichromatium bheemlicum]NKN32200.1 ABC transporter permease [Marichromatium bheemlicum]
MRPRDTLTMALRALVAHRARSALTLLAVALGCAAVVTLSGIGEGARRFVLDEFSQLGTRLLIVVPGRNETTGGAPPLLGETPRDLTLDDALALLRAPGVARVAPVAMGEAPVSTGALAREVGILGTTADYLAIRELALAAGRFLPAAAPERATPVAVLGATLARELFGTANPLGRRIRIADRRFRVIGVLAGSGVSLGTDMADLALIPVASAQAVFDNPGLFRVLVQGRVGADLAVTAEQIRAVVRDRHEGEDDVTVITQDALLGTFDQILSTLTLAVAAIAAISLVVAGVLIMNVMLVSVSQRSAEVGLLKALGASAAQVRALFLTEALMLGALGSLTGLGCGHALLWAIDRQLAGFTLAAPPWASLAAVLTALGSALVFGLLPARRAARLDPVAALDGR